VFLCLLVYAHKCTTALNENNVLYILFLYIEIREHSLIFVRCWIATKASIFSRS